MEKILIVDDSILQAAQLKAILADEYDVTVVQTAEEGLRYAGSGDFSLILLDVVMPGMDGFTLLKKLQEEIITQSIPVILITSLSDVQNEQKGLIIGAVDYITKPFHELIVKARVNTHIKLYNYRMNAEMQSMTDQLTGIANRRKYERCSREKWFEAVRLKAPFSICMFDIDNFKKYNDNIWTPCGGQGDCCCGKSGVRPFPTQYRFFCALWRRGICGNFYWGKLGKDVRASEKNPAGSGRFAYSA